MYSVQSKMYHVIIICFRFPLLCPVLDQSYVAKKTVNAILSNQEVLVIPRMMYFVVFLKK